MVRRPWLSHRVGRPSSAMCSRRWKKNRVTQGGFSALLVYILRKDCYDALSTAWIKNRNYVVISCWIADSAGGFYAACADHAACHVYRRAAVGRGGDSAVLGKRDAASIWA